MSIFQRLEIPDVIEFTPDRHGDERGFFSEVYRRDLWQAQGIDIDWVQENHSHSAAAGTVRGLHLQEPPMAQDKLVRVVSGAILDVAVDIRRGSPSFGHWVSRELSAASWSQLLVPCGFAHGFMTLKPDTQVIYKVSALYSKAHERAIRWDDPDLAIDWPALGSITINDRDRDAPLLADYPTPFEFVGQ